LPVAEIEGLLAAKLRELSAKKNVSIASEIYYDLRISGDDFDELIEWIYTRFGTDFSAMVRQYVPGEAAILPFLLEALGKPPFPSITVRDLLAAIERGAWQESAPNG